MTSFCFLSMPLSQKQKVVWLLLSKGMSVSEIAGKLSTTRQYINQTRSTAEAKLSALLLEVAKANDLQLISLHSKEGLLLAYHPALKRKAIITYSVKHGIKVWFWHDNPEEITNQLFLDQARRYLIDIANERGITIEHMADIHPARLAHIIFAKLVPEINFCIR
jgi:hypothetical protein